MFSSSYIDPIDISDPPLQLANFAAGEAASAGIEKSLLDAIDTSSNLLQKFIEERLVDGKTGKKKSFYDPMPRSSVKTMADMKKTVRINNKNVPIDPEVMYLRLLALNSIKKAPLQRVLSYENAPIPPSLFNESGIITSCVTSDFMHKLEELVSGERIIQVDGCDALIFDGHAVIQSLSPPYSPTKKNYLSGDGFTAFILHFEHQ